jgi:uncharacterized protein YbjQ (UPF0145 family)
MGCMKIIRLIGSLAFVLGLFTCLFAGLPWYVVVAEDPVVPIWLRCAVFALLGGILTVLVSVGIEQRKLKGLVTNELPEVPGSAMLLLNVEDVPNHDVKDVLGLVQGHTVYAIWLGNDLSALIRLILGGELTEYTDMMSKARSVATARMVAQAERQGADAIINVRYMTTSVIGSAAELLAYGTAVKLNPG